MTWIGVFKIKHPLAYVFVVGNATYNSLCQSVGRPVGNAFAFSMKTASTAPAQLITAFAQLITALAQLLLPLLQLITAPAQQFATRVFLLCRSCPENSFTSSL